MEPPSVVLMRLLCRLLFCVCACFLVLMITTAQAQVYCQGWVSQLWQINIELDINTVDQTVDVMIECNAQYWCGIGFNANVMMDEPYTLIIDPTAVFEVKLANGRAIQTIYSASSFSNFSITDSDNTRTFNGQRPLTANGYTFPATAQSLSLIYARGFSNPIDLQATVAVGGVQHERQGSVNLECIDLDDITTTDDVMPENPNPTTTDDGIPSGTQPQLILNYCSVLCTLILFFTLICGLWDCCV